NETAAKKQRRPPSLVPGPRQGTREGGRAAGLWLPGRPPGRIMAAFAPGPHLEAPRMPRLCILLSLTLALAAPPARAADARGLEIVFIDSEGGGSTLLVTPQGESVLIDCGNPGARDAERIHKAATDVGLKAIDHLVITHWHTDHYGGVKRLR